MISRPQYLKMLNKAARRSPVTALLGPRQCGKTTLARIFAQDGQATYFDLESQADLRRLQNPEFVLGALKGLVVLDEIQVLPKLFNALRVLVDRIDNPCRFLILGSASPQIVKDVSETLAGRVEFIELSGFSLQEIGTDHLNEHWLRGGYPRSYLADSTDDSLAWREGFIRTFLERDIPQLGITIPATAMRRFWTMLAHFHGQTWNASHLARSMGLSDKTIRSYLDILTATYMVRQLQPWYANVAKRQVKAPKIYFRDSGLLHRLLGIQDYHGLLGQPQLGASWEGYVIEQILQHLRPAEAYFWSTYSGAEIDLHLKYKGRRYGFEVKFNEAPRVTKSMRIVINDLNLDHLLIIYPGTTPYPIDEKISALPLKDIGTLGN